MREPFRFKHYFDLSSSERERALAEALGRQDWQVHPMKSFKHRRSLQLRTNAYYSKTGIVGAEAIGQSKDSLLFEECLSARSIISRVMSRLGYTELGLATISRMTAGALAPHIDAGAYFDYYHRIQIPLSGDEGTVFICESETVRMKPGEVWGFDNKRVHSVTNTGSSERINLFFDAR